VAPLAAAQFLAEPLFNLFEHIEHINALVTFIASRLCKTAGTLPHPQGGVRNVRRLLDLSKLHRPDAGHCHAYLFLIQESQVNYFLRNAC
jgi:hypothetical protein